MGLLKTEPQSPASFPQDEKKPFPFLWPWIGVLANIPLDWKNGIFVGPTGFTLKQHLSQRGFNPLKVEVLCSNRGHSGFALVHFEKGLKGLEQATMFDKSFQVSCCGNLDWNNVCFSPSNKNLFGWIAREDDYKFEGIVGQNLRKIRGLNSKCVFDNDNDNQMMMMMQHSQVDDDHGFSVCVDELLKQKDKIVQRYHEDMKEAHHSSQKHLEYIISKREKVSVLLEAQKQKIEMRSTELVNGEVLSDTELGKFRNDKLMIEKAILEHRKGDDNLVTLVEKHKKQKEELHKGVVDFEKEVEEKHVLELEIERMRGALRVMRHMRDAGDEKILERIHTIDGQLKEKEEQYNKFEAMNQNLFVNYEFKEGSRNMSTVIRGVREIDYKPFLNVAKRKYSEEEAYGKEIEQ